MPAHPRHLRANVVILEDGTRALAEMRWGVTRFIGEGKMKPATNARNDSLGNR